MQRTFWNATGTHFSEHRLIGMTPGPDVPTNPQLPDKKPPQEQKLEDGDNKKLNETVQKLAQGRLDRSAEKIAQERAKVARTDPAKQPTKKPPETYLGKARQALEETIANLAARYEGSGLEITRGTQKNEYRDEDYYTFTLNGKKIGTAEIRTRVFGPGDAYFVLSTDTTLVAHDSWQEKLDMGAAIEKRLKLSALSAVTRTPGSPKSVPIPMEKAPEAPDALLKKAVTDLCAQYGLTSTGSKDRYELFRGGKFFAKAEILRNLFRTPDAWLQVSTPTTIVEFTEFLPDKNIRKAIERALRLPELSGKISASAGAPVRSEAPSRAPNIATPNTLDPVLPSKPAEPKPVPDNATPVKPTPPPDPVKPRAPIKPDPVPDPKPPVKPKPQDPPPKIPPPPSPKEFSAAGQEKGKDLVLKSGERLIVAKGMELRCDEVGGRKQYTFIADGKQWNGPNAYTIDAGDPSLKKINDYLWAVFSNGTEVGLLSTDADSVRFTPTGKDQIAWHALKFTKANRADALKRIAANGWLLKNASEDLRRDRDTVLAAVKSVPSTLQYADHSLRDDPAIVDAVMEHEDGPYGFAYLGPRSKNTESIVSKAVKGDGILLRHASDTLKANQQIVETAVQSNGNALQYASKDLCKNKSIVEMAVMKGELAEAFQYADESLRRDGTFIVHLIEKYGKPGVFIKHAHQEIFGDRSFVDKLLATADGYAPEILKRTKALNSNRDFILQVAKKYGIDALEYASDDLKKSESFIVQYLQETKDTSVLRKLPSEKRGNARIMSEAVKINPSIFEVASNELKADPNIAILAVRGDPTLYYEVRYPAYREYDIIMAAAKEYPLVLRNLKEEDYEKVSPQVFLDALAKSPSSFGAPEKLMKDRDFMERALNIADLNLSLLHKDLQNDPTFMKKMIDLFVSKNREQLYLNRHPITELPASVATLRNLRSVDLEDCSNLKVLPANLHAREYIGLSRCSSLTSLPENMKTHTLYIHGSGITELPESLVATEVICKKGQLKKIPAKFKGKILEY